MNGVTCSDNISVLVNTMACLRGLGLHATMDSDAADGRFKYPQILFSIIINIITNICFKYYYYKCYYYIALYYYYYYYYYKLLLYYSILNNILNFYY